MTADDASETRGPVRIDGDVNATPFEFLNGTFRTKVSGTETCGGMCVFEIIRTTPGGPPLHLHHAQDEWFLVTEGVFDIQVGGVTHRLSAGDSILGPRGVPHAFRNVSDPGRLVIVFQPAGQMEAFFAAGRGPDPMSEADFVALFPRHGMQVVGPPLPAV